MSRLTAVIVTGAAVLGLLLFVVADAGPSKPEPKTATLAALEQQGIYLTLPAQAQNAISRSRAEDVAAQNGLGGKPTNAFLAQMRDQKGLPGPNRPLAFVGAVWVVELDPATSGLGQPLGGDIRRGGTNGQLPDRPYHNIFSIVFVDAHSGDFLFSTTLSQDQ